MIRQSDTVAQLVQVHGKGDGDAVQVLALDPAALRRGEPVGIGGPKAWYLANYTPDLDGIPVSGPVIGWKDAATGAWVLVAGHSAKLRAGLVEVARDVRLAGNIEPVSPVSFAWVPPGLKTMHDLAGMTSKVINGAQTWYLPRPNRLFVLSPAEGADMVIAAGNCQITVHVSDRTRISEADLDRMVGSATFGDCADASGWRPPLG